MYQYALGACLYNILIAAPVETHLRLCIKHSDAYPPINPVAYLPKSGVNKFPPRKLHL